MKKLIETLAAYLNTEDFNLLMKDTPDGWAFQGRKGEHPLFEGSIPHEQGNHIGELMGFCKKNHIELNIEWKYCFTNS